MQINMDWIKEEWATDLMKDIAMEWLAPKPKESPIASPQLGAGITFADWIIPVSILGAVGLILLFVFVLR